MVIRTEVCSFSELKIFPGRGRRQVQKDGRTLLFLNTKMNSMYHQHKKVHKLRWSIPWRRAHKKLHTDDKVKKKRVKVTRIERGYVGISMDYIRQVREQKPEVRQAEREQYEKELRDKKRKQQERTKMNINKVKISNKMNQGRKK